MSGTHRASSPNTEAQHRECSVKHTDTYWFERLIPAALCHSKNFELSRHDSCWVVQKLEIGLRLLLLFFFILLFSLILQQEENINMVLTAASNPFQIQGGKGQVDTQRALPEHDEKPLTLLRNKLRCINQLAQAMPEWI